MPYKDRQKQQAYDRARRVALKAAGINRDAEYAASHREEIKARAKAWRAANQTRSRASVKAYRKAHQKEAAEWSLAWRQRNKSRVQARLRVWNKKQYALTPELFRERSARRRALKRHTAVGKVNFQDILRDSKGLCGICKEPLDLFGIEFDHIVPLSRGGAHTRENIQATHARCNRSKGAKVS